MRPVWRRPQTVDIGAHAGGGPMSDVARIWTDQLEWFAVFLLSH
jgi:hypothetical protein